MSRGIDTCALLGRFEDESVGESAALVAAQLRERNVAVLVQQSADAQARPAQVEAVPDAELVARSGLAIVIGGDGSLLYAARVIGANGVPLLGINRGRLGFLTDVLPQDSRTCIDAALEGRCQPDHRPLLEARILSPGQPDRVQLALNDVVLAKWETGRILDFETRVEGRYVNTHGGDGLVVATATGSTAYALSCGGPIVEPGLDVLVVVPICPHALSDRPIVVSGQSRVDVSLNERHGTRAQVTCDGVVLGELLAGDRLEVRPSGSRITLLHPPGYDYFRLLRSKLHWGRGSFDHER
jgi:NAD+ kinase